MAAEQSHELSPLDYKTILDLRGLLSAVVDGDVEDVISYLEDGVDPNQQWEKSLPLHSACEQGDVDIVQKLVQAGAKVNIKDGFARLPLFYALNRGHVDVVRYLVEEANCDIDVKDEQRGCGDDEDRTRLLFTAIEKGRLDLVKELVEQYKINPNDVKDDQGRSPLTYARLSCYDPCPIVLYLLKQGCAFSDAEEKSKLLLKATDVGGSLDLVKELIEKHKVAPTVVTDKYGRSPLTFFCSVDIGRYLLKQGYYDAEKKSKVLFTTIDGGNLEFFKELVEEYNVDPDTIRWARLDFFKELVEQYKVDPNGVRDDQGRSLLTCVTLSCSDLYSHLLDSCDIALYLLK